MMKKHDLLDNPPQAESSTKSPGKRIQYRSECMDQLDKWHLLLSRGVITQEQYSECRSQSCQILSV